MAEAIANVLIILGTPLAYCIGRIIISVFSLGQLSIEPLPDKMPANFVQAFDDKKVKRVNHPRLFSVSYEVVIVIGYALLLMAFAFILFYFKDSFINT